MVMVRNCSLVWGFGLFWLLDLGLGVGVLVVLGVWCFVLAGVVLSVRVTAWFGWVLYWSSERGVVLGGLCEGVYVAIVCSRLRGRLGMFFVWLVFVVGGVWGGFVVGSWCRLLLVGFGVGGGTGWLLVGCAEGGVVVVSVGWGLRVGWRRGAGLVAD